MTNAVPPTRNRTPQRNTSEIIQLDFPIDVGGVKMDRITMRRPKVRDRLIIDSQYPNATDAEREIYMFANLCELSKEDMEDLDWADYNKIAKVFVTFTNSPQSKS